MNQQMRDEPIVSLGPVTQGCNRLSDTFSLEPGISDMTWGWNPDNLNTYNNAMKKY